MNVTYLLAYLSNMTGVFDAVLVIRRLHQLDVLFS